MMIYVYVLIYTHAVLVMNVISTSNHNIATSTKTGKNVVFYLISTSNHNISYLSI